MRIISTFKDYYDVGMRFTHEPEPLYIRKTEEITPIPNQVLNNFKNQYGCVDRYTQFIEVCGKKYPFYWHGFWPEVFGYNEDSFKEEEKKRQFRHSRRYSEEYKFSLCDHYNVPIVKYTYNHITINPNLYRLDFYRVQTAIELYSDIRRWLSNRSSPEKPSPVISDELKAQSKGFDKWSFRKQSSQNT